MIYFWPPTVNIKFFFAGLLTLTAVKMVILSALLFVIQPYFAGTTQIVWSQKPISIIFLFPMYEEMLNYMTLSVGAKF